LLTCMFRTYKEATLPEWASLLQLRGDPLSSW
jgi:hypothetical protein